MDDETRKQWKKILTRMLEEYRIQNPKDKRNDRELLDSLFEHFVRTGAVRKEGGKYVLPEIDDPELLIKMLSARRN